MLLLLPLPALRSNYLFIWEWVMVLKGGGNVRPSVVDTRNVQGTPIATAIICLCRF